MSELKESPPRLSENSSGKIYRSELAEAAPRVSSAGQILVQ